MSALELRQSADIAGQHLAGHASDAMSTSMHATLAQKRGSGNGSVSVVGGAQGLPSPPAALLDTRRPPGADHALLDRSAERAGCGQQLATLEETPGQQLAGHEALEQSDQTRAGAPDHAFLDPLEVGQSALQNQFGWAYPSVCLDSLSFKGSFPFKGKGAGATLLRRIDRDQADLVALMQFLVNRASDLPLPITLRVTRSGGEFGSGLRAYLRWCQRGAGQRGINSRTEVLALTPEPLQPLVRQLDADVRWLNFIAAVCRRARSLCAELLRDFSTPGTSPRRDFNSTKPREIT